MKEIISIYKSENNSEWTALNFKAYRNEDGTLVFPESKWIPTTLVTELDIKVGDKVQ